METNSSVETFGDRIDLIIDSLGGPGKAAAAIGTNYTTLKRWKANESEPSLSTLVKISDVAKVSLDWLMRGVEDSGGIDEVNTAMPEIAAMSAAKEISVEEAIDALKTMIQDNQAKLTETEAFLLKEFRVLDSDQQRLVLRFIIGGLDSSSNSGGQGIFNSPDSRIKNSFKG